MKQYTFIKKALYLQFPVVRRPVLNQQKLHKNRAYSCKMEGTASQFFIIQCCNFQPESLRAGNKQCVCLYILC